MKKFKLFFMMFLSAGLLLTACSDDDDDEPTPVNNNNNNSSQNIAEIAIADNRTDSLVVALSQAGLVSTFQSPGTFTVFAPTNQAFVDLLATDPAWNAIADIPNATLTAVLNYHVLPVEVMSADLTDDTYATTLNQGPNMENTVIEVDVTGGASLNNSANITDVDIDASNGVIHIIDEVLMPQNIVEIAMDDERFSTLVSALTAYPSFNFVSTLSGTGPFTVFAPTNDAFQGLLDSNPAWNTLNDIDSTTLSAVLSYHVVNGANVQSGQLMQGQNITTLGGSLTVDLSNGAQLMTSDTSQGPVNIIVTDVQGTNGVIHAVEEVLLP